MIEKSGEASRLIHQAVSGLSVMEAIAVLEIAATHYKQHVVTAMMEAQQNAVAESRRLPDELVDVV